MREIFFRSDVHAGFRNYLRNLGSGTRIPTVVVATYERDGSYEDLFLCSFKGVLCITLIALQRDTILIENFLDGGPR